MKEEVENRGEKIEQAIKVGLGEVTGLLRDLIRVIGEKGEPDPSKAPGMPMPERMEGYPSFPLQNVPSGVGQVGTPATPGMAGMDWEHGSIVRAWTCPEGGVWTWILCRRSASAWSPRSLGIWTAD